MILVLDVGNTNMVFGVYKDDELIVNWRISTYKEKTSDEYSLVFKQIFEFNNINKDDIEAVIIASVVPNLYHTLKNACFKYLEKKPYFVNAQNCPIIKNLYANPDEVGADRIINALAAYVKYKSSIIVVDIGTAITFDVITDKGEYLGGAIAPGIGISSEALFMKTAKLPKVELKIPDNVIGKMTSESIRSGMVYGFIGLIDSIIKEILKEMNWEKKDVRIIFTGGYSQLIAKNSCYMDIIDKTLILEGLNIFYKEFCL